MTGNNDVSQEAGRAGDYDYGAQDDAGTAAPRAAIPRMATPAPLGAGVASRMVADYVRRRFWLPAFAYDRTPECALRINGDEWMVIRDVLEWLLGLGNLDTAMQLVRGRDVHELTHDPDCDEEDEEEDDDWECGYRMVHPQDPGLPNGWMTLLEAAYEQLGDAEGLERLYAYYILTDLPTTQAHGIGTNEEEEEETDEGSDGTDEENGRHCPSGGTASNPNGIIDRLRHLAMRDEDADRAQTHWHELLDAIVHAFEIADDPGFPIRSRTYEELLNRERLSDAAWRYCRRGSDTPWFGTRERARLNRLFDTVAINHAGEACELLLRPLHDADSALMHDDTMENRREIMRTLRRCGDHMGAGRAHAEAERLFRLYRSRTELRDAIAAFMEALPTPDAG